MDYAGGKLAGRKAREFEGQLRVSKELRDDYHLFCQLNEVMRGKFDLEDVKNDSALPQIDSVAKDAISEYQQNSEHSMEDREFINNALGERITDTYTIEEIERIKLEIDEFNVDETTEGWVKEWLENKHNRKAKDPDVEKMISYIRESLETEKHKSVWKIFRGGMNGREKSQMIRIVGLSAAALIAGFLLFRTLVPSSDPDDLYFAFYKPMTAVSPVTRGLNEGLSAQYIAAIEMYKKGNYNSAASMFNEIIQKDTSMPAPHFFGGITQMEMGNYAEAISQLSIVASQSQDYYKEAQWYLGLSYLKTGDKTRAVPYFKVLSETEGYYHDQALKLLRRLK
jgi:tetratricopeptide (TPR) repeat protein